MSAHIKEASSQWISLAEIDRSSTETGKKFGEDGSFLGRAVTKMDKTQFQALVTEAQPKIANVIIAAEKKAKLWNTIHTVLIVATLVFIVTFVTLLATDVVSLPARTIYIIFKSGPLFTMLTSSILWCLANKAKRTADRAKQELACFEQSKTQVNKKEISVNGSIILRGEKHLNTTGTLLQWTTMLMYEQASEKMAENAQMARAEMETV